MVRTLLPEAAVLMAIALIPWPASARTQADRSRAPAVEGDAVGFTVRRLAGPVAVDGRSWIRAEPVAGERTVRAGNGRFTISLAEPSELGDVVRFRLLFGEGAGKPVTLAREPVAYAFITPDSRWIVFEPLEVVDVRTWRRFSLSTSLDVRPYVVLEAISADGRRLVFSRGDCAIDCRDVAREYFELAFPAR